LRNRPRSFLVDCAIDTLVVRVALPACGSGGGQVCYREGKANGLFKF
jgi:hypothetical protein